MTEAAFQAQVIQLAEMRGWLAGHFNDSRRQIRPGVFVGDSRAAGVPDLILVGRRLVWAELKTETGKLSVGQRVWLDRLAGAGCECYLLRPGDLEEVGRVLERGWRFLPRGDRTTRPGRILDRPHLADGDRCWVPGSLWLPGRGRVDEQKEKAA